MIEVSIKQNFNFARISRRLLELAGATLSVIGESYARQVKKDVVRKNLFKSRTGNLFQSITALPKSPFTVVIYGAGRDSFLEYGKYLEFGTRPYVIRPKERKALKIPTLNGYIYRKKVKHPGIKARHYFFGNFESRMKRALKEGEVFFRNNLEAESD